MYFNYADFNIENHDIAFSGNGENDILISIPFAEGTPQCIKDKLNEIISQGMEEWERLWTWAVGLQQAYIPEPGGLLLNAGMQVNYIHNRVQYCIAITITDFELKPDSTGICIDIDVLVPKSSGLYNEFVAYCRYKLDNVLFSLV
ncbi:hypothetical protein D7V86_25745 [bacterium D16-51]|nr:hypothetical protein D7V96_26315 [bacterium D16-59]RKI52672.1 hypothetical protein D7V86_25745 [bacterium D16-51]